MCVCLIRYTLYYNTYGLDSKLTFIYCCDPYLISLHCLVLVERLTGEKYVLKRLRRCTGWLI